MYNEHINKNSGAAFMDDLSKLKSYIHQLKKEHNMSVSIHIDEGDELTKDKIDELIAPLCDSLGLSRTKSEIAGDDLNLVGQVKQYLKLHRNKDITSEDICRHIGCSRSLISHQFKTSTGMSIREYLTILRLEDAKILLENSNLTVTEIAFTVGFGSSNYFTNVFKKQFGIAPGVYKKQYKK